MGLTTVPMVGCKYALITKIGHGSMADVYLGLSEGLEGFAKLAVVKLLRSHLAEDEDFVARFLEEGRIAMRLGHPNVVQTYEVGHEASTYYLAMEYLDGQTLSSALNRMGRSGELDFACQAVILTEVLAALEYAHELADYDGTPLNVVHRDISPPNVFITYDGQVKVLDFGIAKALDSNVETKTGLILGKAAYMAPEQALGRQLDRRADLYAVGVLLWEAASGRRRWERMGEAAIVRELVSSEFVQLPSRVGAGCPIGVEDVLARALAHDPEDRYQTAAEFRQDLEDLLEQSARVTPRQIGVRLARAFRADRERIQREIELQIAKHHGDRRGGFDRAAATLEATNALPNLKPAEREQRTSVEPVTTGAHYLSRAGVRRHGAIAAAAIALGAVGAWSLGRWSASHGSAAVTLPASQSGTPAPPALAMVRITAQPPAAVIYFDDRRLSGNPAVIEHVRDGTLHVVRAEADGFRSATQLLRVESSAQITLRLQPEAPEPRPALTTKQPVARPRATPTARSQPLPVGTASLPEAASPVPDSSTRPPSSEKPEVELDLENPWKR